MSCLFVATYRHPVWTSMAEQDKALAEDAAEKLFPEYEEGKTPAPPEINYRWIAAFDTVVHNRLPADYMQLSDEAAAAAVDQAMTDLPSGDKGPGWIAIVPDDQVTRFKELLGESGSGANGPLRRLYIVEAFPLTDTPASLTLPPMIDIETTNEVYDKMTPTHWRR